MNRRKLLATAAAALAMPAVARAASSSVLKFVPQSDLGLLDPIWSTATVTRNHGYMVFDTLYAQAGPAAGGQALPQMVAGHLVENDGAIWNLTLHDGLLFHDGQKVLARDCVASIRRWGVRDAFGQALMQRTDELSAPDDRTIRFRLKAPFPLLPMALGHTEATMCAMHPGPGFYRGALLSAASGCSPPPTGPILPMFQWASRYSGASDGRHDAIAAYSV